MSSSTIGDGMLVDGARDALRRSLDIPSRNEAPNSGIVQTHPGDDAPSNAPSLDAALAALRAAQSSHPLWRTRLLTACAAGHLTREDLRLVFSQYHLYSRSFTRFLAAFMAGCDDDLARAELAANLWEEGGGAEPEQRHAELFRRFLRRGLDIEVDAIEYLDATRLFVSEYLDFCRHAPSAAASAFLALGTEGIVPRLYRALLEGLRKAGVAEQEMEFFRIHIECDDAHADTLERIMKSHASTPGWFDVCRSAMTRALDLRARFFEQLFDAIEAQRVRGVLDNIQRRESLAPSRAVAAALHHRLGVGGAPLYENRNAELGIDFAVERVPFDADVFDTRVLRVAPHRSNERHRHPHESIFYVIQGRGQVHVDGAVIDVAPGDLVFVPRWATHQSRSTSGEGLLVLALTDFGLTERAFIGNHLQATRLKGTQAPRA